MGTKEFFKQFDTDHNARLNYMEGRKAAKAMKPVMKKMLGDDYHEFSRGQEDFQWAMGTTAQWQGWNDWGPHGDGVSLKDHRRMTRILRKVYQDILDSEEDEAADAADAGAA